MGLDIQIGKASLSTQDRISFLRTMGSWLASGGGKTSVLEAVKNTCDAYSHDEFSTLRPRMDFIVREYSSGQMPLSQALQSAGVGFKPQELAVLDAAEKSNQLRMAVPSLVEALDIRHKGTQKLVRSMTMPLMIGAMLILMSLAVLIFMLPMVIGPVLDRRPDALLKFPTILQYYWFASVWLRANYMVPIAVVSFPIGIFIARLFVPWVRNTLDDIALWLPLTRRIILSFNSVMVVFFMPALLRSGMTTYRVLEELSMCVTHPHLAHLLRTASQDHRGGMRLAQSLERMPFRASFVNSVATGEQTGEIAARVEELKEPYRLEMERYIDMTVGSLKFLVMTILLPFFIVSTYTSLVGPIFALMEYS